ncbi:MAG: hydroxysqualene dehydroxylase HpnE [Terriglobia bacterium]
MNDVIIIGGGFAGLTAGVSLAQAGCKVRLLEQNPYLGGRARSFPYAPAGAVVDNGQHIFMGCYHETLRFLGTLGTADSIRFQPDLMLRFIDRGARATSLTCPHLPAPWHVLAGVMRSNSFTLAEKLQVLRLGHRLRHADFGPRSEKLSGLTVDEWMARLGQSQGLRRKLWDLLCIAAINEDPRIAAAAVFEPVLRLALFQSPADSRIGLASRGLSECYTGAASAYIETRGGRVDIGNRVAGLMLIRGGEGLASGLRCAGVRLSGGEEIEADAVLSAAPPFQMLSFLPEEALPLFASLRGMRASPIVSITLWFDREVTDVDFAGLRGTTVQWLFNRERIVGSAGHCVSLVISGAHEHIAREKEDLLRVAMADLQDLCPAARGARLLHSLVLKERFATFSADAGALAIRPPAVTPIRGFYLAGDWTDTALPATIESAVKSGYTAAAEIARGALP